MTYLATLALQIFFYSVVLMSELQAPEDYICFHVREPINLPCARLNCNSCLCYISSHSISLCYFLRLSRPLPSYLSAECSVALRLLFRCLLCRRTLYRWYTPPREGETMVLNVDESMNLKRLEEKNVRRTDTNKTMTQRFFMKIRLMMNSKWGSQIKKDDEHVVKRKNKLFTFC